MKKISKVLALVLIVALTITMFAACGKKENKKEGGGSSDYSGPAIELLVSPSSTSKENCIYLIKALDRIQERTGGKVTYKLKLSGAGFSSTTSAADELAAGVVDIGDITLQNNPSYFPYTNQSCGQPFLGFTDVFSANDIMRDVLIQNPNDLMQGEFDKVGIIPFLASANFGTALAMNSEADCLTPAGLQGQRIIADNELLKGIIREAGGVEANQGVAEMISALDNKLVEGVFNSTAMFKIFGVASLEKGQSHAKYLYTFGKDLSTQVKVFCISQTSWDSWDPELQDIVKEELFGDQTYADFIEWVHSMEDPQWDIWAANGEPIIKKIEGENIDAWKAIADKVAAAQLEEVRKTAPKIDDAIKIWTDAMAKYYAGK